MSFETFNSFKFMFDRLKRPLHVTIPAPGKGVPDDVGNIVKPAPTEMDVVEPIVSGPLTSGGSGTTETIYANGSGGNTQEITTTWASRTKFLPKGTFVYDKQDKITYQVINSVNNKVSELTYYELQNNEDVAAGDNTASTNDKGDDNTVQPTDQDNNDWY